MDPPYPPDSAFVTLHYKIADLKTDVEQLKRENEQLRLENQELRLENAQLGSELDSSVDDIAILQSELEKSENNPEMSSTTRPTTTHDPCENWEIPTEILSAYQWDRETNDMIPISTDEDKKWCRYVPPEFATKSNLQDMSGPITTTLIPYWTEFKTKMEENVQEFSIKISKHEFNMCNIIRTFFDRVFGWDIKMIEVSRKEISESQSNITVKKLEGNLMPFPNGVVPALNTNIDSLTKLRLSQSLQSVLERLNFNARHGTSGPGTHPCRKPRCELCKVVTGLSVVDFGGEKKIISLKRYDCNSSNVIYLLHCLKCKEEGLFSIHVGFTTTSLKVRINDHFTPTHTHRKNVPAATKDEGKQMIASGNDEHNLRQDSHFHFNFEHDFASRDIGKVTVIQQLNEEELKKPIKHERNAKTNFGSYFYLGYGRGGLNAMGE